MNRLFVKILVPIVALILGLGASLYFVVLRTVNDFAQQNIEEDLENLTHDLFNVVDHEFMQAIKTGRTGDQIALQISQVDCLDILERNTYSRHFKIIVYEQQTGTIRLASDLPGQVSARRVIQHFQPGKDNSLLQIGGEEFHIRQFYFSPWDWGFLILKNKQTYAGLSEKVHQLYQKSAIVLLVTALLFVFYLLRTITNPIASIISSVSQGKSPEYRGTYEFEFLSSAIDEMRTTLKNEVAERERAEKEAEAASKAKSEFLANMSHELRTPLNAILGFAQIMERNRNNLGDQESLRIIQRSGNHLLSLINQVLDLSKIEAGRITVERICFDLVHMLDELKCMLDLKAAKKGIPLTFAISSEVPRYICTDDIKLRQVLINLISNAIKFTNKGFVAVRVASEHYTPPSGTQEERHSGLLSIKHSGCRLTFDIEDTGVGITPGEIKRLFHAFGQTSSGKNVGGSGLGLVISKKFIEMLDGDISLKSTVGKGSTFRFFIPVHVVDIKEAALAASTSRVIGLEPGQPVYRILIVDDNRDNRTLLMRLLAPLGFDLREAQNGREALDIHWDWKPHLIWMDIRMPVMDGIETTKNIRAEITPASQPVIVAMTAYVIQNEMEALLSKGFDDILVKPFRENDLFEMLQKHLDVKYIYEKGKPPSVESIDPGSEKLQLAFADLYALPDEIILQLKKSIATLEMETTLDVIKRISEVNAPLAGALRELIHEYRFDTLQNLLDRSDQL